MNYITHYKNIFYSIVQLLSLQYGQFLLLSDGFTPIVCPHDKHLNVFISLLELIGKNVPFVELCLFLLVSIIIVQLLSLQYGQFLLLSDGFTLIVCLHDNHLNVSISLLELRLFLLLSIDSIIAAEPKSIALESFSFYYLAMTSSILQRQSIQA